MMQAKLTALVVMSIVCGLPAAHAMEASSGPKTMEPQPLHATTPHASIDTSVSPPPSNQAGSLGRSPAPDCDGQRPSTASVTALLSRAVRSSTAARGVQCPMLPDSNLSTVQELHP